MRICGGCLIIECVTTSTQGFARTVAFLFLFTTSAVSQSLQERSDTIRAAVEAGRVSDALTALQSLKAADQSGFSRNNFHYLLARLFEQKGDRAAAAANYQAVLDRNSVLSQYADWHLAQIARSTGDLVLERERLRRLVVVSPTSLLRKAATIRLAESFFESKDYLGVVSTLRSLTQAPDVQLARQALKLSGEAYLRAGKPNEARDQFNKLVITMPDSTRPDDFALAAARALDEIDKGLDISESDHSLRARIYQFNRDFDGARRHYRWIVEKHGGGEEVADSTYQIARGHFQQGNFKDALQTLSPVVAFTDQPRVFVTLLALLAGTHARLKQTDNAVNTYKQFIDRYPTAPNPERAYLNIIDVLRDAGQEEEALSWVKLTRQQFKGQLGDTLALFSQARIHLAQNSWRAALVDLEELEQARDLGGATTAGSASISEINFLKGYAREQLGYSGEAIDAYLSVPEGRNEYYGLRATQRLRSPNFPPAVTHIKKDSIAGEPGSLLASGKFEEARLAAQKQLRFTTDPAGRKELLAIARRAYEAIPAYRFPSFQLLPMGRREVITTAPTQSGDPLSHQVLADELLFLALYDEAAPELAAARGEKTVAKSESTTEKKITAASPNDSYTFAVISLRGGMPYPAVRFAEQLWRGIPSDYLIELAPRQLIEMLYPAPYRASVLQNSQVRQLDPRFVLSIARQETRFQADAKSVAAARGLMQFIAATAEQTAKELGRNDFDQDDLYNPDTAIQFGTQYLSALFRQFPNQSQAVAGAYNGGPDNVARWISRSHSQEPDRYVPEIGFAQSKDYIFRVMSNYWVYQRLYSDSLQPITENQ